MGCSTDVLSDRQDQLRMGWNDVTRTRPVRVHQLHFVVPLL